VLGLAYSASVTPSGRLLRRSANAEDRPALFAAQFALSHVCWLIAYPLVGQVGARVNMAAAFAAMAILAAIGVIAAARLWPAEDPDRIQHSHGDDDVGPEHRKLHADGGHDFVIDRKHPKWPSR
jgi:hypothetical protein